MSLLRRLYPVHRLCHCVFGGEVQSSDPDLDVLSGHCCAHCRPACSTRVRCGHLFWQMHGQPDAQGDRLLLFVFVCGLPGVRRASPLLINLNWMENNMCTAVAIVLFSFELNCRHRVSLISRRKSQSWWWKKVIWRNRWRSWVRRCQRVITRRRCHWRCRSRMLRR